MNIFMRTRLEYPGKIDGKSHIWCTKCKKLFNTSFEAWSYCFQRGLSCKLLPIKHFWKLSLDLQKEIAQSTL